MTGPRARDRCGPSVVRPAFTTVAPVLLALACGPPERGADDGDPRLAEGPTAVADPSAVPGPSAGVADSPALGDGGPQGTRDAATPAGDGAVEDEAIERAIALVEASDLTFVGPRKDEPPDVYSGTQFARVLRRKWRWIGADIHRLDAWIDEIASRSFRSDLPYLVRIADDERPFAPWLRERIAESPW